MVDGGRPCINNNPKNAHTHKLSQHSKNSASNKNRTSISMKLYNGDSNSIACLVDSALFCFFSLHFFPVLIISQHIKLGLLARHMWSISIIVRNQMNGRNVLNSFHASFRPFEYFISFECKTGISTTYIANGDRFLFSKCLVINENGGFRKWLALCCQSILLMCIWNSTCWSVMTLVVHNIHSYFWLCFNF